jgi:DNA processing protein
LVKGEDDYPKNLEGLTDSPYVLYVRGSFIPSDARSVAIVGTRMMTEYGRRMAIMFASSLAKSGITVISGLALGIDAEAQRASTYAGGRTVSVLASGVDIISPFKNKPIALDFISRGLGAVVSENPLGYSPKPFDFPIRDRLIAGLSRAVIVIEGRMKSGTFHTVRSALDYGRSVFAVPGPVGSPTSEGPNYLIQNGAKLVTNISDVIEEIG